MVVILMEALHGTWEWGWDLAHLTMDGTPILWAWDIWEWDMDIIHPL